MFVFLFFKRLVWIVVYCMHAHEVDIGDAVVIVMSWSKFRFGVDAGETAALEVS